jgi:hypothetical protein
LPGGREVCVRLDAAVTAGGNQLGQHVGDLLGSASVVPTLLALAACGKISGGIEGGKGREVNWSSQVWLVGSKFGRAADANPLAANGRGPGA